MVGWLFGISFMHGITISPLQAYGVVRFFHRKHQCYIVGEGTFVGRYGSLPEFSDSSISHEIAESIETTVKQQQHHKIRFPTNLWICNTDSDTIEVDADVEPTCPCEHSEAPAQSTTAASPLTQVTQCAPPTTQSDSHHQIATHTAPGNDTVSEDGD